MYCVWRQDLKGVEFYLSIILCPHLVAGFSLVLFQKARDPKESHPAPPFPIPQRLFHPIQIFIMILSMKREMPPKRRDCSQIKAVLGHLQKSRGLWFCFARTGSPAQVLATFLSHIDADVCSSCNIRTAVRAPLGDLGGELKWSPASTGWGDLNLLNSIELKWCSCLLWTIVCRVIGTGYWRRDISKRLGKYV